MRNCLFSISIFVCVAIFPKLAVAGFWERLAGTSNSVFQSGKCAVQIPLGLPPTDETTRTCVASPEATQFSQVLQLTSASESLAEGSYFAGLAEEKIANNRCAGQFAGDALRLESEFFKFAEDTESKVVNLARHLANISWLDNQITDLQMTADGLSRRKGIPISETGRKIEDFRSRLQKEFAAAASIENSIRLGDLTAVSKLVTQMVQEQTANATSIGGLSAANPLPLLPIDRTKFRTRLRDALTNARTDLATDTGILVRVVNSKGTVIDRGVKESLAQDRTLIESHFQRHPELRTSANQEMVCRVDKKYGSGAEARDTALMAGSVGLTIASLGTGLVVRAGAALLGRTVASTTLAASRGVITARTAQIINGAALALDATTGWEAIEGACFQNNLSLNASSRASASDQCAEFSAENLSRENCVLAGSLTALGMAIPIAMEARLWRAWKPAAEGENAQTQTIAEANIPPRSPNEINAPPQAAIQPGDRYPILAAKLGDDTTAYRTAKNLPAQVRTKLERAVDDLTELEREYLREMDLSGLSPCR